MSAAYTRPLGRYALSPSVGQDFDPVPEGRVWVARDLTFYNGSVTEAQFYFQITSQAGVITLVSSLVATGKALHVDLRQAAVAGEHFTAYATESGQVAVTGYDLSAT